jgi:hypothetical protein
MKFKTQRMLFKAAIVMLVSILLVTTEAAAVDFKGIEIGEPMRRVDESAVFGQLECNPLQMNSDEDSQYVQDLQTNTPGVRQMCVASTSIATIPAEVTVLLGSSRRVLRLTFQFSGQEYPHILRAMTEKWGEAVREVYDNADESVWWVFNDGRSISVHRVRGTASASAVVGVVEYAMPTTTPAGDL